MLIPLTSQSHLMILSANGIETARFTLLIDPNKKKSVRGIVCATGSDAVPGRPPAHPRISAKHGVSYANQEQEARIRAGPSGSHRTPLRTARGAGCRLGDGGQNPGEDSDADSASSRVPLHRPGPHWTRRTAAGVALAEDSTRATAIADRNDELRVRRGIIGAPQRRLHVSGNGSRDQQ